MIKHKPRGMGRLLAALGLLLFAPIAAEYLSAYDDSTGDLSELVGGLFLFAPLYGGAALIIRELTRRSGRGWPTMLILGFAFGVAQAGLIDHSMFNPAYRGIEGWEESFNATFVPALGFNPQLALAFATGHMVWSIAAPIAIVEALVPRRSTTPWLGNLGLALTVVGFLGAAAVVIWWHLETQNFVPSVGHLIGAAAAVIALTVAAFTVRKRPRPGGDRRTASPWLVGATTFVILGSPTAMQLALELADLGSAWQHSLDTWPGLALNLAFLTTLALLLGRWSSRRGWGSIHSLAAAGGALLANVASAFVSQPIGDVSATAKYTHNVVALLGIMTLITIAAVRRQRSQPPGVTRPVSKAKTAA
jgi:hypothetical protein